MSQYTVGLFGTGRKSVPAVPASVVYHHHMPPNEAQHMSLNKKLDEVFRQILDIRTELHSIQHKLDQLGALSNHHTKLLTTTQGRR
jgi:hypothetical protein